MAFSQNSPMILSCRWLIIVLLIPAAAWAQSSIEGMVALPKRRATPVMNKRYEIVTKGGVMSTNPPLAVIYLEGSFAKVEAPPVRQIIQKDFMFSPTLLPVQVGTKVEFPNLDDTYHNVFSFSPANVSTWAATVRTRRRFLRKFWTKRGSSLFAVISMSTCGRLFSFWPLLILSSAVPTAASSSKVCLPAATSSRHGSAAAPHWRSP